MSALKADPESYSKFSIVSPFLKDNLFSCAQLETFRWVHTHHHVYMSYHYIFETVVHASAEPKLGMSCNSQKVTLCSMGICTPVKREFEGA